MSHTHITDFTNRTTRRLVISLGITLAFVVVEVFSGILANSLALLTDAAHNFTDVLALALSWYALYLATRPAHSGKTYGYHRAGILVALFNSTTLAIIALGIFYEAYRRLLAPPQVEAGLLIGIGSLAVVVNLVTALLIRRDAEKDLNLRSAFLHLMGDVLSTLGATAAGIIIRFTSWNWIDPLISIFIGLLILWNAWGIVRESVAILMESTPADIDIEALVSDLEAIEGVHGVHDLHVWSINQALRTLSVHLVTDDISISAGAKIQATVSKVLSREYGISHATLQLECENCVPTVLYCNISANTQTH